MATLDIRLKKVNKIYKEGVNMFAHLVLNIPQLIYFIIALSRCLFIFKETTLRKEIKADIRKQHDLYSRKRRDVTSGPVA